MRIRPFALAGMLLSVSVALPGCQVFQFLFTMHAPPPAAGPFVKPVAPGVPLKAEASVRFSPDGTRYAYVTPDDQRLYVADRVEDSARSTDVANLSLGGWSHDGGSLWLIQRPGTPEAALFMWNLQKGTDPIRVAEGYRPEAMVMAPDGSGALVAGWGADTEPERGSLGLYHQEFASGSWRRLGTLASASVSTVDLERGDSLMVALSPSPIAPRFGWGAQKRAVARLQVPGYTSVHEWVSLNLETGERRSLKRVNSHAPWTLAADGTVIAGSEGSAQHRVDVVTGQEEVRAWSRSGAEWVSPDLRWYLSIPWKEPMTAHDIQTNQAVTITERSMVPLAWTRDGQALFVRTPLRDGLFYYRIQLVR